MSKREVVECALEPEADIGRSESITVSMKCRPVNSIAGLALHMFNRHTGAASASSWISEYDCLKSAASCHKITLVASFVPASDSVSGRHQETMLMQD